MAEDTSQPIDEQWDLVIEPKKKWYDLQIKELWRYRDLIALFIRRDFTARFKQTILGPLWFFIQPLITTIIFTIIFGQIARLPTDGLPQFLFYMSGTLMWSYFSNCFISSSDTFISNSYIFGKVYFPRLVMPVSVLVSNLITFSIQFFFFIAFFVYFKLNGAEVFLTSWAFAFPLLLILEAGIGLGLGIIISSVTTKYRDLRYLVSFGVSLWMYATPIIYPVSTIPEDWQWVAAINPITPLIETFRAGFLGAGNASWAGLAYSAGFMLVVLFLGIVIFNRIEKTFIDTV